MRGEFKSEKNARGEQEEAATISRTTKENIISLSWGPTQFANEHIDSILH